MAVLNLRGVDGVLVKQLKTEAVWVGMGFHEYCVAILERGRSGKHAVMREEREKRQDPRKKIADVSVGGGAQEVVGTPALPLLGKAQSEDNNWRHEVFRKGDNSDIILKPRGHGISTEALRIANLPDGVACGHAGCLSHVSHACEGCGRIAGRRVEPVGGWDICGTCGQVHGEGEYFNHNFVSVKKSEEERDGG